MLPLPFVRDNKETVLAGLAKRGFKETTLIDRLIELDQDRRHTQTTLDQKLAEANQKAKEIGALYKSGNAAEANVLKEQTSWLQNFERSLSNPLQSKKPTSYPTRNHILSRLKKGTTSLVLHINRVEGGLIPARDKWCYF